MRKGLEPTNTEANGAKSHTDTENSHTHVLAIIRGCSIIIKNPLKKHKLSKYPDYGEYLGHLVLMNTKVKANMSMGTLKILQKAQSLAT